MTIELDETLRARITKIRSGATSERAVLIKAAIEAINWVLRKKTGKYMTTEETRDVSDLFTDITSEFTIRRNS